MSIVGSPVESERFQLDIGRAFVGTSDDVPSLSEFAEFDITFLRTPADNCTIASRLAVLPDHAGFIADHLCHWRWPSNRGLGTIDLPPGWSVDLDPSTDMVEQVVRSSFDGYRNHYAANPLLAEFTVVDAYVEWGQTLMRDPQATAAVLMDDHGSAAAVAVVDWTDSCPGIRLAGVSSDQQRRGLYPVLLQHVMLLALERGRTAVEISTQSHNVAVMRAWARLGFEPLRTVATFHVVRYDLLSGVVPRHDEKSAR